MKILVNVVFDVSPVEQLYTFYFLFSQEEWKKGMLLAEAQNFARMLAEAPANKMTPTIFAETVKEKHGLAENLEIQAR